MDSEATPGLPSRYRDKSFPARTRVIGVIDPIANPQVAYLKREVTQRGVVKNDVLNIFLIALGDTVNAFKGNVTGRAVQLTIAQMACFPTLIAGRYGMLVESTKTDRSSLIWKSSRFLMSTGSPGRPSIPTAS